MMHAPDPYQITPTTKPVIKIVVNYFAATTIIATKSLLPVQLGAAHAKTRLPIQGDDEGDNISEKNSSYCELTGQYWVWKNELGADYYGSMHYRRFFDFRPANTRRVGQHGVVVEPKLDQAAIQEYGLDDQSIANAVDGYDLILPQPFDVSAVECASVYDQYNTAEWHYGSDLETAGEVIAELSPEYIAAFRSVCTGKFLYPNNMFILRSTIFEELNRWIFQVLEVLEKRLDTRRYNAAEGRALGYIAERLFTVFVVRYLEKHPEAKVLELRRVFFSDTSVPQVVPTISARDCNHVTLAASCDRSYVPQLGALIASTFRNASHDRFIDFFVLDGGILSADKLKLQELCRLHPYCRITFVDLSNRFKHIETHSYFPTSTFYRLALPDLLPDRGKVLFLDTDMVVLKDVGVLFDTDLEGRSVAAVPDLIMRSFRALGVTSAKEALGQRAATYLAEVLRIDRQDDYFQAGVLLFDLERLRQSKVMSRMQIDLVRNRFWFLDQDVLNKHMFGDVFLLDNRWNVVWMDDHHLGALPAKDRSIYAASHSNPFIIHFAGAHKPWLSFVHPEATYFWTYLRDTHWYELAWLEISRQAFVVNSRSDLGLEVAHQRQMTIPLHERVPLDSMPANLAGKAWRALPLQARRSMLPLGERVKSWFASR